MPGAGGEGGVVRVLGVDPGSAVTGWGIVEGAGSRLRHLASGTISTRGCPSFAARLLRIHEEIRRLIRVWTPGVLGVEWAFVAQNVQTAFRLGEARGAVLVGAAVEGLDVHGYAPAAVKLAVTGSGRADKEQVARGVARLLRLDTPLSGDAADALAVAVCHIGAAGLRRRLPGETLQSRRARPGPSRVTPVEAAGRAVASRRPVPVVPARLARGGRRRARWEG
jgi:crossover junction endodeoxyribonuclease RuvC